MSLTNQITISLVDSASARTVALAHAAIDAFFGNVGAHGSDTLSAAIALAEPSKSIEDVAAAQVPGNIELDANGLPWHADIHASTKTKTAAGVWTKRKGVADATVDAVTAQLRAAGYVAAPAAVTTVATATVPAVSVPSINIAPRSKYQELVDFLAQHVGKGKLDQATVDSTFAQHGKTLATLAGDEVYSAAFLDGFKQFVG